MDIRAYNTKDLPYHFVLFYNLERKDMEMYKKSLVGRPGDNALLTYCYLDTMCGLSYKAICCAEITNEGHLMFSMSDKVTTAIIFREGGIIADAKLFEEDDLPPFKERAEQIKEIYGYHEELIKVNEDKPFDKFRHPSYPKDILVSFFPREGKTEDMWVTEKKILDDGSVQGILINEPFNPDFELHEGDAVLVVPYKTEDGEIIPIAKLPWI